MDGMGYMPVAAWGVIDDFAYGPASPFLTTIPDFAGNLNGDYGIGGSYVERPKSVSFSLTTVGGAGTRVGLVQFLDQGGVVFAAAAAPFAVAAGFTSRITLTVGATDGGATSGPAIVGSLPPIYLQPTYTLRVSIVGGLAADTVAGVRILTDRFSTAPQVFPPGQGPDGT